MQSFLLEKPEIDAYAFYFMLIIIDCRLTVGVTRLGWELGLAVETGKTQSQKKAQKTRGLPQVGCTHC